MIKVCDAMMGSGKTSAAITYINEHPDKKYIYIAPYLTEAARIKQACPDAQLIEPSKKMPAYGFNKMNHTTALIAEGRNIATTHQCFTHYTFEMLNAIKKQGYTLLLDETLSVLEDFKYNQDDIDLMLERGLMEEHDNVFILTDAAYEYQGTVLSKIIDIAKCRELIRVRDNDKYLHYWSLPERYLRAFDDVIIMTYMFEGQPMSMYLRMCGMPYTNVGVRMCDDGLYRFFDGKTEAPSYAKELRDHIHVCDNWKMNNNFWEDGERTTCSMNWFQTHPEGVSQLQRNLQNYFRGLNKGVGADEFMWGTYVRDKNKLKGKGYTKGYVPFNARATNEFRHKTKLAYAANPYMNVNEKRFFQQNGVDVDEATYALSVLVQWIWRSAIRDGKDIDIYLPAERMRELLDGWLDDLSEGGERNV